MIVLHPTLTTIPPKNTKLTVVFLTVVVLFSEVVGVAKKH
jgi:hypothetical protein